MIRNSLLVIACGLALAQPAFAAKKKQKPEAKPPAAKPAEPPKPAEAPQPAPEPAKTTEIKAAPAPAAPPPAAKKPEATKKSEAAPTNVKSDDMDFDLLGEAPKISEADRKQAELMEKEGKTRRAVLQTHTGFGFALLGLMTINTVLGTLNYYDKFAGGGFTRNFELAHLISSLTTTGVFALQGGLAIFAPDPYPKPGRWDPGRWHRIFMASAAVGMAAQVVLGFVSSARYGNLDQRDLARSHLAIGYITYALTLAGAAAWLF